MNDLTGAFINALEKGQDINFVKEGLINAGYSPMEIEEAMREAQQINYLSFYKKSNNQGKKSSLGKIFLIFFLISLFLLILGFVIWYFFLGGKESEMLSSLLEKLNLKK